MSKFQLSKGKIEEPEFFILYGVEGIGKSTFASKAPNPVIIDIEGGSKQIDTVRIDEQSLQTVEDIIDAVGELADSDFETIVIDSISRLEKIILNRVAVDKKKESIEDIGYAKGYIYALTYWERLLDACKAAKLKGKNIIMIAHNHQKTFNDPTMIEGYTRYELELHHKAASLLKKNVDAIYFANYKVLIKEGRGLDTGERYMHTQRRAGHDAKNRFDLPYAIKLDWDEYIKAKGSTQESKEDIREQINSYITEIPSEEVRNKINEALKEDLSVKGLKAYLKRVQQIAGEDDA